MHISAQVKYHVELSKSDKIILSSLIRKGSARAQIITRARILLLTHEGRKDREIIKSLQVATSTPHDIRKRYTEGGIKRAIYDAPRPGQKRKLTGGQEAQVIAIACSTAPKGYSRWTLDLLTEEVNEKVGVKTGRTAIWRVLLRNDAKPWQKKMWCIPKVTADFKKNA